MLNKTRKSCLEAFELRQQQRNLIGGLDYLSHKKFDDPNKMLLDGDWVNSDISYGQGYFSGMYQQLNRSLFWRMQNLII